MSAHASSRDSGNDPLRRSQRERRALIKRRRRRLEIQSASYHRYASLRRGTPGYGLEPIDQSKNEHLRTDRPLYGTTPAVPSVHEACQPDRRVNTDSATLPSVERADSSPTTIQKRQRIWERLVTDRPSPCGGPTHALNVCRPPPPGLRQHRQETKPYEWIQSQSPFSGLSSG
jgi:hypothetical protein